MQISKLVAESMFIVFVLNVLLWCPSTHTYTVHHKVIQNWMQISTGVEQKLNTKTSSVMQKC